MKFTKKNLRIIFQSEQTLPVTTRRAAEQMLPKHLLSTTSVKVTNNKRYWNNQNTDWYSWSTFFPHFPPLQINKFYYEYFSCLWSCTCFSTPDHSYLSLVFLTMFVYIDEAQVVCSSTTKPLQSAQIIDPFDMKSTERGVSKGNLQRPNSTISMGNAADEVVQFMIS